LSKKKHCFCYYPLFCKRYSIMRLKTPHPILWSRVKIRPSLVFSINILPASLHATCQYLCEAWSGHILYCIYSCSSSATFCTMYRNKRIIYRLPPTPSLLGAGCVPIEICRQRRPTIDVVFIIEWVQSIFSYLSGPRYHIVYDSFHTPPPE
jgi:hypothetical protein